MNKLDIRNTGKLHESTKHDSADKHVSGRAEYIDDIVEPRGTLHAYLGLASRAHAELASVDLDAVRTAPGVVGVLTAADIPGENDISSPHKHDDPVFAEGKVQFYGQPIFAVIGETRCGAPGGQVGKNRISRPAGAAFDGSRGRSRLTPRYRTAQA